MTCSKKPHVTRSAARLWLKKFPGEHMRPYKCPSCPYWHVGHLPRSVRKGRVSTHEIYGEAT